jgi:hypothetical protein
MAKASKLVLMVVMSASTPLVGKNTGKEGNIIFSLILRMGNDITEDLLVHR